MHPQQTALDYPVEKTLFLPPSLRLSLSLLSLHSLIPLPPPSRFQPSIHDWETRACLTLERLIMRQSYERADRRMAREWFRRRPGRQIEGFWRVSAVSRVALRREEVSFFVGSSGRSERYGKGGRERPVLCCKCRRWQTIRLKFSGFADDTGFRLASVLVIVTRQHTNHGNTLCLILRSE